MFVELISVHTTLKEVIEKDVNRAIRHELVDYERQVYNVSLRFACRAVVISDSVYRYQPKALDKHEQVCPKKSLFIPRQEGLFTSLTVFTRELVISECKLFSIGRLIYW